MIFCERLFNENLLSQSASVEARHTFSVNVLLSYLIERYSERTHKSFMFLPEARTAPHKISLRRASIPQRVRIILYPPLYTRDEDTELHTIY